MRIRDGMHMILYYVFVCTKIIFPRSRFIGDAYCRMLLHDTMLNSDRYRTGISYTPIRDCGMINKGCYYYYYS